MNCTQLARGRHRVSKFVYGAKGVVHIMRRGLLVLLSPLIFSVAVAAQTQVSGGLLVSGKAEAVLARVSPDEVVSRMLTFDRDHDGKVAGSELAERMQPLMARGDRNRDGALDSAEIRALAVAPPAPVTRQGRLGGVFGSSYGFADLVFSFSSLNHIEGAIEDLKLTADAREQALSIAKTFVDAIEADAEANLAKELQGILSPEQLVTLQQVLKTPARAVTVRTQNGTDARILIMTGFSHQSLLRGVALSSEAHRQAQGPVDRYVARVKLGEGERAALVDQLKGLLNVEERDNLRAALARRPVVATGGVFIDAAQANLQRLLNETIRTKALVEVEVTPLQAR